MSVRVVTYEDYKRRVYECLPIDVKREFSGTFKVEVEEVFDGMVREDFARQSKEWEREIDELRSRGELV